MEGDACPERVSGKVEFRSSGDFAGCPFQLDEYSSAARLEYEAGKEGRGRQQLHFRFRVSERGRAAVEGIRKADEREVFREGYSANKD